MLSAIEYGWPGDLSEKKHKCSLCFAEGVVRRVYNSADQYEKLIGIHFDTRVWFRCPSCGLHWQANGLTDDLLRDIYRHYRDTFFRKESVKEIFLRIENLHPSESENEYRYQWFRNHVGMEKGSVLDIGSGFGIWPAMLKRHGWEIYCTEPNEESCKFINEYLHIPCQNSFNLDQVEGPYDVVTIVHVLEHIEFHTDFLKGIKGVLKPGGTLFVEVPDASEFEYLDASHDEFNSCHIFFYDTPSLFRLLNRDFNVTDIHRVHHKTRDLSRIMAICRNIG